MPDLSFEIAAGRDDGKIICGADEVGRGPLAGPVMAAAAIIPAGGLPPDIAMRVKDSKQLSDRQREALFPILTTLCPHAVAAASVAEISALNILHASMLAMSRAVTALPQIPIMALIDGNRCPKNLPCAAQAIVKGDSKSQSIAVAAIIAKVTRDRLMKQLAQDYPAYGWDRNAGYPTPDHLRALEDWGVTPWHRASFGPVAKILARAA